MFKNALSIYRQSFNFSGKLTRRDFILWIVFFVLMLTVTVFATGLIRVNTGHYYYLPQLFTVLSVIANLSANVRRLHDTGRRGWWVLLPMTIIGLPIYLYLIFLPGNDKGFVKQQTNPTIEEIVKQPTI